MRVQSDLPIAGQAALAAGSAVDLSITLGRMPPWIKRKPEPVLRASYTSPTWDEGGRPRLVVSKLGAGESHYLFQYYDGTEFLINRVGSRVWATWQEPLTLEDAATYLLGPVCGFVLRLRGVTCLHASAVAIGDRAVALVGPAGAGKSTTAAALAMRGHRVLSEDVLALSSDGSGFVVEPGYPRVRLWPESVAALFGAADALPRLTPNWDKRCFDLSAHDCEFQQQPLPLRAIYLLGERSKDPRSPCVKTVTGAEALLALVANAYTNYLLDQGMRAREFELLGRLVTDTPIRRVIPHSDSSYLPKLCDLLIDDAKSIYSI
jgi:hypothetical protein